MLSNAVANGSLINGSRRGKTGVVFLTYVEAIAIAVAPGAMTSGDVKKTWTDIWLFSSNPPLISFGVILLFTLWTYIFSLYIPIELTAGQLLSTFTVCG